MKQILATTALLALSAGFASAEGHITLSGDARMGIIGGDGIDTAFTSRARVKFSMSGETDGGLAFGASFRADNAGDAASGTAGSVFVSTGGFKLSMGDVDGAAQAAMGQVDGVGLTGLGDMNELAFLGDGGTNAFLVDYPFSIVPGTPNLNGDPTALFEYSTGGVSLYASATQLDYVLASSGTFYDGDTLAVGAAYATGGYRVSLGYESLKVVSPFVDGSANNLVVGADAVFADVTVKARYSVGGSKSADIIVAQENTQWAVSATYVADALSFTGYVSDYVLEFDYTGQPNVERRTYGIGSAYDLGGGASVVGGYAVDTTADTSAFDLGLSFSF